MQNQDTAVILNPPTDRLMGHDGNLLHTPSTGFRRNPPLLLEGNNGNYFINKPPLLFPSLGRRGGIGVAQSPLTAVPAYDDRGLDADTRLMPRGYATAIREGGHTVGAGVVTEIVE